MAIITISRGTLSGGRAVAEALAEQLGYPCVAREVLQDAARDVGVSQEALEEQFETTPHFWSRLKRERELYVLAVQATLAEQCTGGALVYHGLAGQFLLRDLPAVLRVRLIAPLEARVEELAKSRHRMERGTAEDFIRHLDDQRRRWVRSMYDEDVEDPALYDLTVELKRLSRDAACTAISAAASLPEYEVTDEVRSRLREFAETCRAQLDEKLDDWHGGNGSRDRDPSGVNG